MKIVVLDGYMENPGDLSWESIAALGEFTVYDRTKPEEVVLRIGDAEAVLENKIAMTAAVIDACPKLRYIGEMATGYNNVDIAAARRHGIVVTNIPSYSTASVGQLAIALLLEICHHVGAHSEAVHGGQWEKSPDPTFWNYPLIELAGKTMGIVGFGHTGQCTARIARALGMRILTYSRSIREEGKALAEYVSFDQLLAESDVISLNCPLFPETSGLINKKNIAKMKDGVIIINTSRGGVINEQDLADALNSGKVYAAGVDVVSQEPIHADNPLLKAKNCIITPHIAWAPKEPRSRLLEIASENLKQFLAGTPINNVAK